MYYDRTLYAYLLFGAALCAGLYYFILCHRRKLDGFDRPDVLHELNKRIVPGLIALTAGMGQPQELFARIEKKIRRYGFTDQELIFPRKEILRRTIVSLTDRLRELDDDMHQLGRDAEGGDLARTHELTLYARHCLMKRWARLEGPDLLTSLA